MTEPTIPTKTTEAVVSVTDRFADYMRYMEQLRESDERVRIADQKLADERERHRDDLRRSDQEAVRLVQSANDSYLALVSKYNDAHFLQLNENAKRTIEERGHFVSAEAFDPFKTQVLEFMSKTSGRNTAYGIAAVVLGFAIATLLRFVG